MATHGIKVSRNGFDVKTASDKQLAFSSEAPLLPIEAEGTYTIESGSKTYDIYTHGLGYYPVFSVWKETSGNRYHLSENSGVYVSTTKLSYDGYSAEEYTLHWKVYRRNLRNNYTSENINTTDATEEDSGDFGLLVSLPGKDVSSTDKRDFGIRSDVRQLMIHKSGYIDESLGETIDHNLGYKPIYWFFQKNEFLPNRYYPVAPTDDFVISSSNTQLTFTFYSFIPYDWAYIIFKDPVNQNG